MEKRRPLFSTTVGKKILSALTGLFLSAFLVVHLLGNLAIFPGQGEWINVYANALAGIPITIILELGLVALILAHAYMGIRVWKENKAARGQDYALRRWTKDGKTTEGPHKSRKSVSSTTMAISGTLVLLFIVVHIIHFRFGKYNYPLHSETTTALTHAAEGASASPVTHGEDVAGMVNSAFQNPLWVIFYVVALVLTGLHLNHGFASAFQSLGISGYTKIWAWVGRIFTAVVIGGFIVIPIWVYIYR